MYPSVRESDRRRSLALARMLACCRQRLSRDAASGPARRSAAKVSTEPWSYDEQPGKVLKHASTTSSTRRSPIAESSRACRRCWKGRITQYQMLRHRADARHGPMKCYIFAKRAEWAEFTAEHTGADCARSTSRSPAADTRIGDWFVSYYVGDTADLLRHRARGLAPIRLARISRAGCRRSSKRAPPACSRA